MKQTYRMGVIGLGEGRSIMSAALQSERWELKQVCDLNEELCRQREREFGFPHWTTSYEQMLDSDEIDVIAIYTPDQLHFTHIVQAIRAGKHVICTKPVLPSLDDAAKLLAFMNESDRKLFIGQSTRYFEPMLRQRSDFEAGKHGELSVVEAHYITDGRWFLDKGWSRQQGFSWFYGFMIHAVDLVRWYLPDVSEVSGYALTSANTRAFGLEAWDSLRFTARNEAGQIATLAGDYALPTLGQHAQSQIGCVLRGTEGVSRAEYSNLVYYTNFAEEGPKVHSLHDRESYYFRFENRSHHAGEYQNYIEHFADCLDRGETPLPDAAEAVRTLALMEAMTRSVKRGGQPVRLAEVVADYGL
ncbi:Gfo/Idh/MocA family protein [Cohnella fermenti]|uniref:Gfo/Idh/MocA family oxidoreductase n=1 Tax=Cohnella fermenti TaxID=2565925 RepID=A0A4S4BVH3_9BACL|nr:Gfo/Idh/MocA family oxidoreductase [Cohnella fermenti]THF79141.1 Gfo/Idh/MocA family oxidoreductase [Cohnella fermenti]